MVGTKFEIKNVGYFHRNGIEQQVEEGLLMENEIEKTKKTPE